jgi:hypothetical protein
VIDAYIYRDVSLVSSGEAVVCIVDRCAADAYLSQGEVENLFGGCAVYATPEGREFVGVWGARNAARFRRYLRERGAQVLIHHRRSFDLRLRATKTTGNRPRVRVI